MNRAATQQQVLMFLYLCVMWGGTWIGMKVGTATVPPGVFSGLRWTVAGGAVLAYLALRGQPVRFPWHLFGRVLLVALLMITLNVVVMLYGLRLVGTGLASVVSSALTPVALLGFATILGQERFDRRQFGAIALGVGGIFLLFGPKAALGRFDLAEMIGTFMIIAGNLSYCLGSVMARPLMRSLTPLQMAGVTNFIGGFTLLIGSILFEPGAVAALQLDWGWAPWLSWWFLVVPASLGATTVYFVLMRDWGATRTGTYAFISPIVTVVLGMLLLGEQLYALDAFGMALMLVAAWVALRK